MSALAARLDAVLKEAVPGAIVGVQIGRRDDPETWRIDFAEDATEEQKVAAQAALEAFDPTEPEPVPLSPLEKLKAFLAANPDVAAAIGA